MRDAPVIGIDLGTTNSVVAVADGTGPIVLRNGQGQALTPSAVSFHPSGEVLVGSAARDRRAVDAENTILSVKRLLGRPFESAEVERARARLPFKLTRARQGGIEVVARGHNYALPEISAFVLRRLRELAEESLGQPCTEAVVTVPANFNELQRAATKTAGQIAGLDVRRILNEPTAAALAYGYGERASGRIAVYDLGGGTFDVSVLEIGADLIEVIGTAGDSYLGGDDLDSLLVARMVGSFLRAHRVDLAEDPQARARLQAAAEWLKCSLSERDSAAVHLREVAYGPHGQALDLHFELPRAELEELAGPVLARTEPICEQALRRAGVHASQLDAVILVGGQTRAPQVRALVQRFFGRPPLDDVDPELVVAQGAALQALALAPDSQLQPLMLRGRSRSFESKSSARDSVLPDGDVLDVDLDDAPTRVSRLPEPPPGFLSEPALSVPPPAAPPSAGGGVPGRSLPPPLPLPSLPAPPQASGYLASAEPAPGAQDDEPELPATGASVHPLRRPPLLLDVTPLTLAIETTGGFCEQVIAGNSPIPTEQTRVFSTSRDNQTEVELRICQGESRQVDQNQIMGTLVLRGLRAAARGEVEIGVSFVVELDGTLLARATDLTTGQAQEVHINLLGSYSSDDVDAMRQHQERLVRGLG